VDPAVAPACREVALHQLRTGQVQPSTLVDSALRADPAFLAAHCVRAALLVMSCRLDRLDELAPALDAAHRVLHLADVCERRHLDAAGAWLDKTLKHALRLYGEITADDPHDTLALRVAHFGDLQWERTQGAARSHRAKPPARCMPSPMRWRTRAAPKRG
jgi:hypothetical protein